MHNSICDSKRKMVLVLQSNYVRKQILTFRQYVFVILFLYFHSKLPPVEYLIVNLYREADRKKKKDRNTLIGNRNNLRENSHNLGFKMTQRREHWCAGHMMTISI